MTSNVTDETQSAINFFFSTIASMLNRSKVLPNKYLYIYYNVGSQTLNSQEFNRDAVNLINLGQRSWSFCIIPKTGISNGIPLKSDFKSKEEEKKTTEIYIMFFGVINKSNVVVGGRLWSMTSYYQNVYDCNVWAFVFIHSWN